MTSYILADQTYFPLRKTEVLGDWPAITACFKGGVLMKSQSIMLRLEHDTERLLRLWRSPDGNINLLHLVFNEPVQPGNWTNDTFNDLQTMYEEWLARYEIAQTLKGNTSAKDQANWRAMNVQKTDGLSVDSGREWTAAEVFHQRWTEWSTNHFEATKTVFPMSRLTPKIEDLYTVLRALMTEFQTLPLSRPL